MNEYRNPYIGKGFIQRINTKKVINVKKKLSTLCVLVLMVASLLPAALAQETSTCSVTYTLAEVTGASDTSTFSVGGAAPVPVTGTFAPGTGVTGAAKSTGNAAAAECTGGLVPGDEKLVTEEQDNAEVALENGLEALTDYVATVSSTSAMDSIIIRAKPKGDFSVVVNDVNIDLGTDTIVDYGFGSDGNTIYGGFVLNDGVNNIPYIISYDAATDTLTQEYYTSPTVTGVADNIPVAGGVPLYAFITGSPTIQLFEGIGPASAFTYTSELGTTPNSIAAGTSDLPFILAMGDGTNIVTAGFTFGPLTLVADQGVTGTDNVIGIGLAGPTNSINAVVGDGNIYSFDGAGTLNFLNVLTTTAQGINDFAFDTSSEKFVVGTNLVTGGSIAEIDASGITGIAADDETAFSNFGADGIEYVVQSSDGSWSGVGEDGSSDGYLVRASQDNIFAVEQIEFDTPGGGNEIAKAIAADTNGGVFVTADDVTGADGFLIKWNYLIALPEFGTIALLVAVLGALGGVAIIRRRGEQQ